MKPLRIYADTSVIGGCFDEEFRTESNALIQLFHNHKAQLLLSDLIMIELERAPDRIQKVITDLPDNVIEILNQSDESRRLRDQYMTEKIVGKSQTNDAHHVAIATVANADMIVSWNFKHLVHYDKIRGFNAINLREGYKPLSIYSPLEVI